MKLFMGNVGQGNLMAVRVGDEAMVVDCGYHRTSSKYNKLQTQCTLIEEGALTDEPPLQTFLRGSTVKFVITHKHYDHYSFLREVVSWSTHTNGSIFYNDFGKGPKIPFPEGIKIKRILARKDASDGLALGKAEVNFILPTEGVKKGRKRSTDPNDNSLVLTVTLGADKILFTGDASGATLNAIQQVPENLKMLKNVTCIAIPHHGSNLNGEFAWFYFVKDHSDIGIPILGLVSSDPKEADHLPWYGISQLVCNRNTKVITTILTHAINTAKELVTTDQPIFLSSDAKHGFWTVVFNGGKTHTAPEVYDGMPCKGMDFFINDHSGVLSEPDLSEKRKKYPIESLPASIPVSDMSDIIDNARVLYGDNSEKLGKFLLTNYIPEVQNKNALTLYFISSCLNKIDIIFTTESMRSSFITFVGQFIQNPDILKLFIDKFDIFSDEQKVMIVENVLKVLQNSEISQSNKLEIFNSCVFNSLLMKSKVFTNSLMEKIDIANVLLTKEQLYSCIEESENFSQELRKFFSGYFVAYVTYESKTQMSFEDWHHYLINAATYFPEIIGEIANIKHSLQVKTDETID